MKVRDAVPEDAAAACQVVRRSIAALCLADHRNDPEIMGRWLGNKTPEYSGRGSSLVIPCLLPSRGIISLRWAPLPTPARPRSITFRRMRGFAESAARCSMLLKIARSNAAMSCARSKVPKPRGASTSKEDILKTDPLTENSAPLSATRCQSAWVVQNHEL